MSLISENENTLLYFYRQLSPKGQKDLLVLLRRIIKSQNHEVLVTEDNKLWRVRVVNGMGEITSDSTYPSDFAEKSIRIVVDRELENDSRCVVTVWKGNEIWFDPESE